MNWSIVYNNLIERAKCRKLDKSVYIEKHHILPKSLGGTNSVENIVKLTAREHLVAHLLLTKITVGSDRMSMLTALFKMVNCNKMKFNSRLYEKLKKEAMLARSNSAWKVNIGNANRKSSKSPEWRAKQKAGAIAGHTPEWYTRNLKAIQKRSKDSKWIESNKQAIKRLNLDEEFCTRRANLNKVNGKSPKWQALNLLGSINRTGKVNKFPPREGLFEIIRENKNNAKVDLALALLST